MESGRWWMVTRRWTRRRQWTVSNNEGNDQGWISPLLDFCKFLEKEARILCSPVTSLQALKTEESRTRLIPEEQGTPHGTMEILAWEPLRLVHQRRKETPLVKADQVQVAINELFVCSIKRTMNLICAWSLRRYPFLIGRSFLKTMHYAEDVSSGAICIKSAEAERPAGPAIADIQPHCKIIQQCLKTSLPFKESNMPL